MRNYELTYIVKPDVDATSLTALIERVNGFITAEGGTVAKTNQWGLRHLSYPIRKFRDGHYVFSIVELEVSALTRVEQRLRLVEDILRYLLVRADEDSGAADITDVKADVMGGVETSEPEVAGVTEVTTAEPAAEQAAPAAA